MASGLLEVRAQSDLECTEVDGFPDSQGTASSTLSANSHAFINFRAAKPFAFQTIDSGKADAFAAHTVWHRDTVLHVHRTSDDCPAPTDPRFSGGHAELITAIYVLTLSDTSWTWDRVVCYHARYVAAAITSFLPMPAGGGNDDSTVWMPLGPWPEAVASTDPIVFTSRFNAAKHSGAVDVMSSVTKSTAHMILLDISSILSANPKSSSSGTHVVTDVVTTKTFVLPAALAASRPDESSAFTDSDVSFNGVTLRRPRSSSDDDVPSLVFTVSHTTARYGKAYTLRWGGGAADRVTWTRAGVAGDVREGAKVSEVTSVVLDLSRDTMAPTRGVWLGGRADSLFDRIVTTMSRRMIGAEAYYVGECGGVNWGYGLADGDGICVVAAKDVGNGAGGAPHMWSHGALSSLGYVGDGGRGSSLVVGEHLAASELPSGYQYTFPGIDTPVTPPFLAIGATQSPPPPDAALRATTTVSASADATTAGAATRTAPPPPTDAAGGADDADAVSTVAKGGGSGSTIAAIVIVVVALAVAVGGTAVVLYVVHRPYTWVRTRHSAFDANGDPRM